MNTTRRGWLTAFSSLIALPLVTKSGSVSAQSEPQRSLVDHFASLRYRDQPSPMPVEHDWLSKPCVPVTLMDLSFHEEILTDSMHYLYVRKESLMAIEAVGEELRCLRLAHSILTQMPSGRPVTFRYDGGSTPGCLRTVLPTLVFHRCGTPLYLQAYCLERLATRTFRLDRISGLKPLV